jgi:hypothetical protein
LDVIVNMGSHRADVVMTSIMMQLALGARQGSKPEGGNAAFGFVEKGMVVPFTRAEGRRCEDRPETGLIHALRTLAAGIHLLYGGRFALSVLSAFV